MTAIPADQPTIQWILSRHGLTVVCESRPHGDRFDLILTLHGYATEAQICAAHPGSPEQVRSWRAIYEAHGWRPA